MGLLLILSIIIIKTSLAFEIPLCRAVNYSGRISEFYSGKPQKLLYTFNLDLKVSEFNPATVSSDLETDSNEIILSNFNEWSIDNSKYDRVSSYRLIVKDYNAKNVTLVCPTLNETCILFSPNGQTELRFDFLNYGQILDFSNVFISDGIIFDFSQGNLMNKKNLPCLNADTGYSFLHVSLDVCCTEYDNLEILDETIDRCEEFDSNITIMDLTQNLNKTFFLKYSVAQNSPTSFTYSMENNVTTDVTEFYYLSFFGKPNCIDECSFAMEDSQIQIIKLNYYIKNATKELNYEGIIAGEIISKSGNLLNFNQIFTPEHPCWTKKSEISDTTGIYESSLCCVKFNREPINFREDFLSTVAITEEEHSTFASNSMPPTSSSSDFTDKEFSEKSYFYILSAVAVLMLIIILPWIIHQIIVRKKSIKMQRTFKNAIQKKAQEKIKSIEAKAATNNQCCWISYIEAPNLLIDYNNVLGKGSKATVYKGILSSKTTYNYIYKKVFNRILRCNVAAKLPLHFGSDEAEEFIRELNSLMSLKGHPNIVMLFGWTMRNNIPILVTELAETNLLNFVKSKTPLSSAIPYLQLLWQISKALEYVAEIRMIHRDVACRNILIMPQNVAKLADFGLCCHCDEMSSEFQDSSHTRFPIRWLSIEVLKKFVFSEKSDVWAFGVLCFEVFSRGEIPYSEMLNSEILAFLENGNRLSQPLNAPYPPYELMQRCWSKYPSERPKFSEITKTLRIVLEKETYGYFAWLNLINIQFFIIYSAIQKVSQKSNKIN